MASNEESPPIPAPAEGSTTDKPRDNKSLTKVRPARPSRVLALIPWLLLLTFLVLQTVSVWVGVRHSKDSKEMISALKAYGPAVKRLETENANATKEAAAVGTASLRLGGLVEKYGAVKENDAELKHAQTDLETVRAELGESNKAVAQLQKNKEELERQVKELAKEKKDPPKGTPKDPEPVVVPTAVTQEQIAKVLEDWRKKHTEITDRLTLLDNSLGGLSTNYAAFRKALADGGDQQAHGALLVIFHQGGKTPDSPTPTPLLGIPAIKEFCERQPLNLAFPKFRFGVTVMRGKTADPYLKFASHPPQDIGKLGNPIDYKSEPDKSESFAAAGEHVRTELNTSVEASTGSTAVILLVGEESQPPAVDDPIWKALGEKARIHVFAVIGRAANDTKPSALSKLPEWVEFSRRHRGTLTCLSATKDKEWQLDEAQLSEALLRTARPSILPIAKEAKK